MKKYIAVFILIAIVFCSMILQSCDENEIEINNNDTGNTEMDSEIPEEDANVNKPAGLMRDITTMELVYDMGMGINLGNTMEVCGNWIDSGSLDNYETAWGSPLTTEALIVKYAEAGFSTVRIPVSWSNMMLPDYVIHPDLLDRVRQIVDWVIDNGMYAIVNIHWDMGWIEEMFPENEAEAFKKYESVWTQVCERFKDYSDYLMFESMNEPGFDNIWNRYGGENPEKPKAYDLLNRINQRFVELVRASGSNNAERHLLIAGYFTDIENTCDPLYQMPGDPKGRCALSVHYYTPWQFVGMDKDESWGKAQREWGSSADFDELNRLMDMMKTNYVDKGIPVIVGEYSMCSTKEKEYSDLWEISVTRAIYERGMCPVLWDIQGSSTGFLDRNKLTFGNIEVLTAMQEIAALRD